MAGCATGDREDVSVGPGRKHEGNALLDAGDGNTRPEDARAARGRYAEQCVALAIFASLKQPGRSLRVKSRLKSTAQVSRAY